MSVASQAAKLAVAVGLFLASVEGGVRVADPTPRTQVVRFLGAAEHLRVETVEGAPVFWQDAAGWRALRLRDCRAEVGPDGLVVALVGDSILYLSDVDDAEANLAVTLEDHLARRLGRPVCVLNGAFSGSSAQQKSAMARWYARHRDPDLIVWEVWGEEPTYRWIGDDLYAVGTYDLDALGTPRIPGLPMPPFMRRALFVHSRAFEHASLAFGARDDLGDALDHHRAALDALETLEVPSVWAFFPALDRPLDEPADSLHAVHPPLRALLAARGIAPVDMRPLLAHADVTAIRLDPCCHYNRDGHAVVGAALAELLADHPALTPPR